MIGDYANCANPHLEPMTMMEAEEPLVRLWPIAFLITLNFPILMNLDLWRVGNGTNLFNLQMVSFEENHH